MKELYELAEDYEIQGNPKGFTETYLKALEIQFKELRLHPPASELHLQILPLDVLRLIFSFCNPIDVSRCMQVSKAWYVIARDGLVWKNLFAKKWKNLIPLEEGEIICNPSIRDWYTIYKHRQLLKIGNYRCVAIDESGIAIKFGLVDSKIPEPLPHQLIKASDRISHIRSKTVVKISTSSYYNPIPLDSRSRHYYWREIFQRLGVQSDRHPLIVSVSPHLQNVNQYMNDIVDTVQIYFRSPAVCFVDAPILALYSASQFVPCLFPAVVLIFEGNEISITAISENRECIHHFLTKKEGNDSRDSKIELPINAFGENFLKEAAQKIRDSYGLFGKNISQPMNILLSGNRIDDSISAELESQLEKMEPFSATKFRFVKQLEPQTDSICGALFFASLNSFKSLFQHQNRILDLTSNHSERTFF